MSFSSACFTFIWFFFTICFLPHLFPFIISSRVLHRPPPPPWVVLLCVCELGLLPTMAFVFYHKFMWLTSRLRQAERGRQSAELDNRLFKQDFGDKINSLQLEVEALTRQRTQLELELKQEKEKKSQNRAAPGKVTQKPEPRMDGKHRIQEDSVTLKKPLEEGPGLLTHPAEEQGQPSGSEKAQVCQLCREDESLTKNTCKHCRGTFCNACMTNELPLPSSIKPELVCNPCHEQLIKQYSTSPS
ncbi:rap2 interacting protein x, isoform CRA_e [Rattus norvegicus]|uniref:Rap2 interacting protein x, isoform CRA_e n=1 Tax=Rattus norvegicus TaxID=10116 RepID=A6KKI7_RAT|nr:rap2 interacting protein x, isoform CRA_e [Rattus norvegicus]EDL88525.1 rap2 interacting protein x, isoform CRA_e [Rattus norvegicus]